jgi:probable metal-binding protein
METPASIHGHDVIHMITEANRAFSKEELVSEIDAKFGEGARFHTCSEENMNAAGLVEFLISRGKFTAEGPALSIDPSKICKH